MNVVILGQGNFVKGKDDTALQTHLIAGGLRTSTLPLGQGGSDNIQSLRVSGGR